MTEVSFDSYIGTGLLGSLPDIFPMRSWMNQDLILHLLNALTFSSVDVIFAAYFVVMMNLSKPTFYGTSENTQFITLFHPSNLFTMIIAQAHSVYLCIHVCAYTCLWANHKDENDVQAIISQRQNPAPSLILSKK